MDNVNDAQFIMWVEEYNFYLRVNCEVAIQLKRKQELDKQNENENHSATRLLK